MIVETLARGAALGRRSWFVAAVALPVAMTVSACAQLRKTDTTATVLIDGGSFLMGSTLDDRAAALELGHASRGRVTPEATLWIKREFRQTKVELGEFRIMQRPVTQREYFKYMLATGAPEPYVDEMTWAQLDLGHDYAVVERSLWPGGGPDPKRIDHPVVLVSQREALTYCVWWGQQHGGSGWLPSEAQWEKAARGADGWRYPWGDEYRAGHLNSAEAGPGDTVAVGSFPEGASPYGVLDMAGNVFEWTSTREGEAQYIVKGGAWNSDGASSRAAARHARPESLRHVAVGFRCVLSAAEKKRLGGKVKGKPGAGAESKKKSRRERKRAAKDGAAKGDVERKKERARGEVKGGAGAGTLRTTG